MHNLNVIDKYKDALKYLENKFYSMTGVPLDKEGLEPIRQETLALLESEVFQRAHRVLREEARKQVIEAKTKKDLDEAVMLSRYIENVYTVLKNIILTSSQLSAEVVNQPNNSQPGDKQ